MAKEKFARTKPHVNIGTIGHVDHGHKGGLVGVDNGRELPSSSRIGTMMACTPWLRPSLPGV